MKTNNTSIFPLEGVVQHYAWGGKSFLPAILHTPNPDEKPFAEYWLGAHEKASSSILINGIRQSLLSTIAGNPVATIGQSATDTFGRLPYLLKVLDVHDMLSIQVHPTKAEAEKGYQEENIRNISLQAPERNYRDNNHKPELMVALGDFYLLHGFREEKKMIQILQEVPALEKFSGLFQKLGYKELYRHIMEMPQHEVNEILEPLLDEIISKYEAGVLLKDDPHFWAARAALHFNGQGIDRGIFSIYFFNLVALKKGEAVFQDAGVPHAYLEGQNVEIMANSDNVLRGGLTSKHIDVPELMKHVKFEATIPRIIHPVSSSDGKELIFPTSARDFQLSLVRLNEGENMELRSLSGEIYFVYRGEVSFICTNEQINLIEGQAIFAYAGGEFGIHATSDTAIFRATVPLTSSDRVIE